MKKIFTKLTMLLIALTMSTSLMAANQIVDNNADAGVGTTLREAIAAVGDGENITFNISSSDVITISSELLISAKGMTINGYNNATGNNVTIQVTIPGTSTFRVFNINATNKTSNISNMTIKGGDISTGGYGTIATWGGSIINIAGTLNLDNITITGSKADWGGGVYTENDDTTPTTTFNNCNISSCTAVNWGGGVYGWEAIVNINNSTISSNVAGGGGGIANDYSTCNLVNCLISSNISTDTYGGGGIINYGGNGPAIMTISNTTIQGNTADSYGGGIYQSDYEEGNSLTLTINSSTIANNHANNNNSGDQNGGGIYFDAGTAGTIAVQNTIIANNYRGSTTTINDDYYYQSGTLTNYGYNVVEYSNVAANATGGFNNANDILYNTKYGVTGINFTSWTQNASVLGNQTLDLATSLSYNGGFTEILPITGGGFLSASEGAGSTTETTDQRGYYRTASAITRGAYQYNAVVAKIGTVTSWTADGNYTSIDAAYNAATTGNTIELAGTAIFESGISLDESKMVTIRRDDALSASTYVQAAATSGTASDRVFNITAGTVTLEDITVRNGVVDNGAGIYAGGASTILTLNDITVSGNVATTAYGGGIWGIGSTININRSTISNNSTATDRNVYGGGLLMSDATLTMINSTVANNEARSGGGGIFIKGTSTVSLNGCTIANNHSDYTDASSYGGGGIYLEAGTLSVKNTLLANNYRGSGTTSDDYYYSAGTLTDDGYNIVEITNTAAGAGGFTNGTNNDIVGQQANLFGTGLSTQSLADNGGTTKTLAITSGSVAIAAGNWDASITTDQRGEIRHNPNPTIGAYEPRYSGYWTGSTNSDWGTSGNWDDGSVAEASDDVIIPDVTNDPIINESPGTPAICDKLTILSDATLTINAGKAMTINGDLDNSGTLTVNSTVDGTGSLIVNGTTTSDVTMQRYMNNADFADWRDGWHFLSSPVTAQDILSNFVTTPANTYDFYCWWELTNEWINYKNTTIAPTWTTANVISNELSNDPANFLVGKGYMAAYDAEGIKSFTGALNVADVDISGLTIAGTSGANRSWHLLGNPFSSALTWDATIDWNKTNIEGTAQIWNEDGQSYSAITAGNVIPATNGFMVQVSSGTGTLTIPKAKRVHDDQAFYKNTAFPYIKLKANNMDSPSFQESQVLFNPASTTDYDLEFDGHFLPGYAPLFYSRINGDPMAVNSMPNIEETTTIPFTFIKNEGLNFSIEMYKVGNMEMDTWLFDEKLNKDHNLTENPIYIFTAFEQDDPERFVIHFSPLGVEEPTSAQELIQIWSSNNTINILNTNNYVGDIKVVNMFGQTVLSTKLNGEKNQKISINAPSGYYIINAITQKGVVNKKLYLK